jgi:hypothetical protein
MIENYCGFESSLARYFCAELKEAKKKPAESSFERLSLRGRAPSRVFNCGGELLREAFTARESSLREGFTVF